MTVGTQSSGRVLEPVERLSEILFGLIMVLTFTCTISVANADREEVRGVLIGAIGCNVAWGIVDGVMYLMSVLLDRGHGLRIARAVRAAKDPAQGRKLVADALPEPLDELLEESALEGVRARILALPETKQKPRLTIRDFKGALGVFLLVFLSTFPVVVPFLVFPHLHRAMRFSNAVAIVMLYLTGHSYGHHAGLGKVATGLAMVAIGLLLVAITIALGG